MMMMMMMMMIANEKSYMVDLKENLKYVSNECWPPPWYKEGGGGEGTPPQSFWYVAVFRNDLAFRGSLWSSKHDEVILWVVRLLKALDDTNNGRHLGLRLGVYQEIEIRLKLQQIVFACALLMNKHFA